MKIAIDIAIIIVTIFLIAKGADWLVDSSVRIARKFNISELVIGLTKYGRYFGWKYCWLKHI